MHFSEKIDTKISTENAPTDDINNANNNTETATTPVDDSDCKTVSNNNWWGSWISSAKTKVSSPQTLIQKNRIKKTLMYFKLAHLPGRMQVLTSSQLIKNV